MALESCQTCGYAIGIADQRCRHCFPLVRAVPWFAKLDSKLVILIFSSVLLLGSLIYRMLFH